MNNIESTLRDYYSRLNTQRDYLTFEEYNERTKEYAKRIEKKYDKLALIVSVIGFILGVSAGVVFSNL